MSGPVQLRPMTLDDVAVLSPWMQDPKAMAYWATPPLVSQTQVEDFVRKNLPEVVGGAATAWMILEGEAAAGFVNVYDIRNRMAGIGYMIAPERWGRGLAPAAVQAVLAKAFGVLDLHRVYLDIDPDNKASVRVAGKLGFRLEAHMRENFLRDGIYLDSLIYALLQREWRERQPI